MTRIIVEMLQATGPAIFEWYKMYKVQAENTEDLSLTFDRPCEFDSHPDTALHGAPRYCLGQSDAAKKILSRLPQDSANSAI